MQTALRVSAGVGVAIHLIHGVVLSLSISSTQMWSFVYLLGLLLSCALVVGLMARQSCRDLFRNVDVFVPIGCYLLATDLLGLLVMVPVLGSWLEHSTTLSLITVSMPLSGVGLIRFLVDTVTTAWVTLLILGVLVSGRAVASESLLEVPASFLRVLVVRFICHSGVLLGLMLGLALLGALLLLGPLGGIIAMVVMGPLIVVFNLLTFFLIATALDGPEGLSLGFRRGLRIAVGSWRRVIAPIIGFSVVVGSLAYFTYLRSGAKLTIHLDVKWLADYPTTSAWSGALSKVLAVEPIAFVTAMSHIVIFALGIVLSLEIFRRAGLEEWLGRERMTTA